MTGLLSGVRVLEFQGLGPGPFCATMLADHGADVIRIDRPGGQFDPYDVFARSRRSIAVDLKTADGIAVVRDLCRTSDALIEGFRPGVMERLGLGPDVLLEDNPKLIYGRMTGWGQYGPLAMAAGHDINYIALSGILSTIGRRGEKPVPPVNYLGDFGAGGMLLAFAIVAGILGVRSGNPGQVIDAAMTDGSAMLAGMTWQMFGGGYWEDRQGTNWLDTGAHFYDTYLCSDGKSISIGSIEPQFYAALREALGIADDPDFDPQMDFTKWPELKEKIAAIFLGKSRDEWCAIMEGTDICFAPVLSLSEAPHHPHNVARETFVPVVNDVLQPAPAPRFSRTPASAPRPARQPGADSRSVLADLGYDARRIDALEEVGAVHRAVPIDPDRPVEPFGILPRKSPPRSGE